MSFGETFWGTQVSCFSSYFCPLILTSFDDSCLQWLFLWCLSNGNYDFFLHLLVEIPLFLKKVFPYLFIHLFDYISMDSWIFTLFHRLLFILSVTSFYELEYQDFKISSCTIKFNFRQNIQLFLPSVPWVIKWKYYLLCCTQNSFPNYKMWYKW